MGHAAFASWHITGVDDGALFGVRNRRPHDSAEVPRSEARLLRVLVVEDSEPDVAIVLLALKQAGYAPQHRRVETATDMAAALKEQPWDLVIADCSLPGFDALGALEVMSQSGLDLPFIIVSGTIGEDLAVIMMKMGAHDYVNKSNLARLGAAVEREMREAAGRRARQQMEQSLRNSEAYLRAILDNVPDGIVIVDDAGLIEHFNPAAERTFRCAQGVAIGRRFGDLLAGPPGDQDEVDVLAPGARQVIGKRADGSRFPMDLSVSEMQPSDQRLRVVIVRDITERKRLEEQLLQAQKTESLGRLAGGIAHDFNNLLAVILSYANLAVREVPSLSRVHGDLEEIQQAAHRAAGLTRQLLTFSRRVVLEPRVLNVNDLILDMSKMLQRLISEDIELVFTPARKLGMVRADPGQLEQVLMNLVLNARDAMPEGGRLIIETSNAEIDDVYAERHAGVRPGPFVLLAVSDTGVGMTEEVKARLFEPFFTSKEAGKGTGLGLATTYGIVKQSGGFIWLYSEPDHGTTFKVYLPSIPAAAESRAAPRPATEAPRGTETVLVVEDEPALREVAVRGLREQGYVVLQASDGLEAVRVSERYEAKIHLLLTDVVMPGMSGPKLAERLRSTRPDIKVLFTSGYTDATFPRHTVDASIEFVQKPFTIMALARKVHDALHPAWIDVGRSA